MAKTGKDFTGFVLVRGAREHNLKNVNLDIPRDVLVVFTGISGSGKSSLTFGTLYAEAQLITGSADGLGLLAAKELVKQGNMVVLPARNNNRAKEALSKVPGAETALSGDLSDTDGTKKLADKINQLGSFDAFIHNAGVYQMPAQTILSVNTIARYILTCLVEAPKRLIYFSSGDHLNGDPTLAGLNAQPPRVRYSDSKLHDLILAKAVARKWPDVFSNALDPGWVPTKMGGAGAPDDLQKGYETQVWLAVSDDPKAVVSGKYFRHQRESKYQLKSEDEAVQGEFLHLCEQISGMAFKV